MKRRGVYDRGSCVDSDTLEITASSQFVVGEKGVARATSLEVSRQDKF